MRSSSKLAVVTVAAIAVAGASPFFIDSLRMPNGPMASVGAAGSSAASTVSAAWRQVVALVSEPAASATADSSDVSDARITTASVRVAQAGPTRSPPAASPNGGTAKSTAVPNSAGPAGAQLSPGDLALVMTLVRNTLVAVHQANLTGNYTVLRDLGAPPFRDANTASRLAELFAPIRARNIDLSGAVLLEPRLTVAKVNDQGMLNIAGALPTQPISLNFDMLYQGVANAWQLFAITISA